MELSTIRFVAADMDGTLLNGRHELSPEFFPVYEKMKEKGVLFAAASGRQFFNLYNRFKSISDEVIFIAENGSYVVHKGEDLLVQDMHRDDVKRLLTEVRKIPNAFPILCGKKGAYIEDAFPSFIEHVEMYYDRYWQVDNLSDVEDDRFLKIAICDLAGSEQNSYPHFCHELDNLQVKISGSIWLDLSHKLANKGKAIALIQSRYGISMEETMVFGDYLNDLEMMYQAGYSFAMENAHPDIKHAAKYLAASNEENGVIEVLKQMLRSMNGSS
jgi:Cof subfamily protein (haloacid dehalogenase superfamily)